MKKPKIFINYAREDVKHAERLRNDLKQKGFDPWFDKKTNLSGAELETRVSQEIIRSDYFIPIFSKTSVRKDGYVQAEIRVALERSRLKPPGMVFVIPIRVDLCEPSYEEIKKLVWIDMMSDWERGLTEIIETIRRSEHTRDYNKNLNAHSPPKNPLDVIIASTPQKGGQFAAETVWNTIIENCVRAPRIGLFTGTTSHYVYDKFVKLVVQRKEAGNDDKEAIERTEWFIDGEFLGLESSHENSYRQIIEKSLIKPIESALGVKIDREHRVHAISGTLRHGNVDSHCQEFDSLLRDRIHLQMMGVAPDGQSMFISPGQYSLEELQNRYTTLVPLSDKTISYITPRPIHPYVFTIGPGNIIRYADRLLILAFGPRKKDIVELFVNGEANDQYPVTVLRRHSSVTLIVDEHSAEGIKPQEAVVIKKI